MEDRPQYVVAGRAAPDAITAHLLAVRDHYLALNTSRRKRQTAAAVASLFLLAGGLTAGTVVHASGFADISLAFVAVGLFAVFLTEILFHAPACFDARAARRAADICDALRLAVADFLPPLNAPGSNIHNHRRVAWALYSVLPSIAGDLPAPPDIDDSLHQILFDGRSLVDSYAGNSARIAG